MTEYNCDDCNLDCAMVVESLCRNSLIEECKQLQARIEELETSYKALIKGHAKLLEYEKILRGKVTTLEAENKKLKKALIWCSGSADFGQGGQAEIGWNKICRPLLKKNGTKNRD